MDMEVLNFDERIKKIREKVKNQVIKESAFQKVIDMVRFTPYVKQNEIIQCRCSTWPDYSDVDFYFEDTPVDEFIEGVLGKLHREYGINWKLDLIGDVEDPLFVFRPIETWSWCNRHLGTYVGITFSVKEGQFKQCRVEKVITEPEKVEWKEVKEDAKTQLRMVCE